MTTTTTPAPIYLQSADRNLNSAASTIAWAVNRTGEFVKAAGGRVPAIVDIHEILAAEYDGGKKVDLSLFYFCRDIQLSLPKSGTLGGKTLKTLHTLCQLWRDTRHPPSDPTKSPVPDRAVLEAFAVAPYFRRHFGPYVPGPATPIPAQ
jgi:hypothetical protein